VLVVDRRVGWMAAAVLVASCTPVPGATHPVRREERVQVEDARLYLLTRGRDSNAPVMLWLHGGPGGAERPLFRMYNAKLEQRFVVAYWDQRGAARSFDPKADPSRLTISRHLADMDVVIDHLRRTYGKDKVILLGHSWGATLGLLYAQAHPEKVAAFVGVGQPTNELQRQRAQYDFVITEAHRRGDAEALQRIDAIGPPPFSARREIATQRLVERYGGYYRKSPSMALLIARGIAGGYVRPWELARLFRGNAVSLEAMNDEMLKLDLPTTTPVVSTPVVFMLGRYDRQVDSRLAAKYFEALSAPHKRLMWFENSAHNVPFEEPALFNDAVPRLLAEVGAVPTAIARAPAPEGVAP
jgi:pimeloyl-ACP methyl ester carboxylesterase